MKNLLKIANNKVIAYIFLFGFITTAEAAFPIGKVCFQFSESQWGVHTLVLKSTKDTWVYSLYGSDNSLPSAVNGSVYYNRNEGLFIFGIHATHGIPYDLFGGLAPATLTSVAGRGWIGVTTPNGLNLEPVTIEKIRCPSGGGG